MKKLNIDYPGKTQFAIEDVMYMQQAYMEAMYDIVRATGADNMKLHGCNVSASAITAGAVIIGGEVCRVDAASQNFASGTWWLQKQSNYDAAGNRIFLDGTINGTERQVFEIIKAVPVQSATQPANSISIVSEYLFEHTHYADEINVDSYRTFVSEAEKVSWNSKAPGTHSHDPSEINTDSNNRFVTDAEKNNWNSKAAGTHSHAPAEINTDANNRFVTDANINNWNSKAAGAHSHAPADINTDASNRFVTDANISNWNSKVAAASVSSVVDDGTTHAFNTFYSQNGTCSHNGGGAFWKSTKIAGVVITEFQFDFLLDSDSNYITFRFNGVSLLPASDNATAKYRMIPVKIKSGTAEAGDGSTEFDGALIVTGNTPTACKLVKTNRTATAFISSVGYTVYGSFTFHE